MKIVKKENGNTLLTDASGNTIKRFPEGAVIELDKDREGEFVRIAYGHQNKHDIYPSTITHTQIEPAAEVAFSGTAQDLLNLLSTSFFFEVVGGGLERIYESGSFVFFNSGIQASPANISNSANNIRGVLIEVPSSITVEGINIQIATGAVGNGVAGVYEVGANGQAGDLIAQVNGEYDTNLVGDQTVNFTSNLDLTPNYYVLAFNCDAAITIKGTNNSIPFRQNNGNTILPAINYILASTYNATMPSNISGGTINNSASLFLTLKLA